MPKEYLNGNNLSAIVVPGLISVPFFIARRVLPEPKVPYAENK